MKTCGHCEYDEATGALTVQCDACRAFDAGMHNQLGKFLRETRTSKNLTLRDVEAACGISNAYLSQLENGKISKPSPHFLKKLAELYDANFEEFMQLASYIDTATVMVKCEVCGHYQKVTEGSK